MSPTGPRKDRWDPTSSKANPHWASMYAAKRRAIDRALLAEVERTIGAEPVMVDPRADMRAEIAKAFGSPPP